MGPLGGLSLIFERRVIYQRTRNPINSEGGGGALLKKGGAGIHKGQCCSGHYLTTVECQQLSVLVLLLLYFLLRKYPLFTFIKNGDDTDCER